MHMSASASKPSAQPTMFEFTRRKRWAELLVHELSEAIVFILSRDVKIWFCSRAVSELLGWSDVELIDHPLTDLVNEEDQLAFHVAFDESLRTNTEMNSYVRFKARSPVIPQNVPQSEVLFELKGYPYFIDNELAPRCFFAVARPYPSRNIAMLNTVLELKAENERLQTRLAELRVRAPSPPTPTCPSHPVRSSSVSRSSGPSVSHYPPDASVPSTLYPRHPLRAPYDNFALAGNQIEGAAYELHGLHAYGGQYAPASATQLADDDLGDETSRRKRIRKTHNVELYVCVTCGRTDSPEWRKGPQGPKTLCNACGLRWAKEVRSKVDENTLAENSTANDA